MNFGSRWKILRSSRIQNRPMRFYFPNRGETQAVACQWNYNSFSLLRIIEPCVVGCRHIWYVGLVDKSSTNCYRQHVIGCPRSSSKLFRERFLVLVPNSIFEWYLIFEARSRDLSTSSIAMNATTYDDKKDSLRHFADGFPKGHKQPISSIHCRSHDWFKPASISHESSKLRSHESPFREPQNYQPVGKCPLANQQRTAKHYASCHDWESKTVCK